VTFDALVDRIAALPGRRAVVAIVGPPASGKSTLAERLVEALPAAALVAMDGFHLDDRILTPRGLRPRKGAPDTYDVGGLRRVIDAIRAGEEVFVPVFDRAREIAVAAASVVPAGARIVILEGNWLALDRPGWRELGPWDLTVRLEVPEAVLRARLEARWAWMDEAARAEKIDGNDLPNARAVLTESLPVDVILSEDDVAPSG
jgi:fructokinase